MKSKREKARASSAWKVEISSSAEKKFHKLGQKVQTRIFESLRELAALNDPGTHGDVRPLVGELRGFLRLRVGEYRIIFSLLTQERIIAVVNIAPRGQVY
ncbi:MAG: type II toxin-antitoxin system RelE/ParE family toxin [Candidatus Wallbacteria bacterium]|nr:type II toxin-antitoxin system RelE/ParE family toxin [Candidatus Wallbacteria bacterium]